MSLGLIFLLMLVFTVGLTLYATRTTPGEKNVKARVADITNRIGRETPVSQSPALELEVTRESAMSQWLSGVLESNSLGEHLQKLILHAGAKVAVGRIVMMMGFLGLTVGFLLQHFVGLIYLSLLGVAAGAWLPYLWLQFKKGRKLKKFGEALPDAIDLMSRALRAGHSMASSIEVIAQQSAEPLASEFAACFQQQKYGMPYREALLEMAERVPSEDLHFVLTAILVQKETGGDLTEILDRTTRLIRERIKLKGEIQTHTAQGRLTGMLLAAMPVVLMLILNLISPGYSDLLFHDSIGQKLLIGSGVMIFIGGMVIRKIVDIKV